MKRRNFIGLLGGAVAFPFAAHAQQDRGVRRIAVLQPFAIDSPEKPRVEAFVQELQRLGWTDGRNLQIEYRWETSDLRAFGIEEKPMAFVSVGSDLPVLAYASVTHKT